MIGAKRDDGNTTTSSGGPCPSSGGNTSPSGGASSSGGGKKLQATVTGYGGCLTPGMACGLTGSPWKDPTAAMSIHMIPIYGRGTCGTCWKLTNPRNLKYHDLGRVPTIGDPFPANSTRGDGMVVLINNSCNPGEDQYQEGAVGQCAQTDSKPTDNLGSQTVLDLCEDTNAATMLWNSTKPGMAVADIQQVDCSEWTGTVRKAS